MSNDTADRKSEMRQSMRGVLDALSDEERHAASALACTRLAGLDAFLAASVVMLYVPLATEVDLTPAAIRCFRAGMTVCVPRVDWDRGDMAPVEVRTFDDRVMEVDRHGVRTPRGGPPVPPAVIDLIVVPGLAYDTHGYRLGRGGGFYDRFLARLRRSTIPVGLAFDCQIVDAVPVDQLDRAVDIVVTERRVTRANGSHARK